MVTELPARRDLCDDKLRQATLVEFRGSNLSDAGSIPAISTEQIDQQCNCWSIHLTLDNYIRRGYSVGMKMVIHFVWMVGTTMLVVLCIFYPFFPGAYDGLAVTLSAMSQLLGIVGLLLVPIGAVWLAYELWKKTRRKRNLPYRDREYYFAIASLIAACIVAIIVSLFAFLSMGLSFGLPTLALWFYIVSRLIPGLKLLKKAEAESINPTPFYLIFIPVAVLLIQVTFAARAIEFSRNRAITSSAELIDEIERHHAEQGRYPSSLLAVNKDYKSSIVGIERYHYAPNGDAYNLFFELPALLLNNFGTREFVVYNKLDEHVIPSHVYWILIWTPEELEANQGWYAVHDASSPHWKYFWFD